MGNFSHREAIKDRQLKNVLELVQVKTSALKPTGDPFIFRCFNYLNSGFYCLSNSIIVGRMWPWPLAVIGVPHAFIWNRFICLMTTRTVSTLVLLSLRSCSLVKAFSSQFMGSEAVSSTFNKEQQPLSLWKDKVPFAQCRVRELVQNAEDRTRLWQVAAEGQGGNSPSSFAITVERMQFPAVLDQNSYPHQHRGAQKRCRHLRDSLTPFSYCF